MFNVLIIAGIISNMVRLTLEGKDYQRVTWIDLQNNAIHAPDYSTERASLADNEISVERST